jgi:2-polyprenylphenol 6-hydroxylase
MSRPDFDVLIGGGGMVGAALATLLATRGASSPLRIALIEPQPALMPLPQEPVDVRVSAISRAGQRLLTEVGAWSLLRPRAPSAYERMIVWDAQDAPSGANALIFDAAEMGEPDLGHIIENRAIAAALIERAVALGVTLLRTPVTGLALDRDGATVDLAERRVTTSLVVAADGADSPIRGLAGLGGDPLPYPQTAVVTHLRPERDHGGAARQRFLPGGPLALLPLADGRVSLVWSLPPSDAQAVLALDDTAFSAAVTAASDTVLGSLRVVAERRGFPLRHFNAERYATTRLVLIGDAAHAVHPLAGQGVNQGFLDVLKLVDELMATRERGGDIGDPGPLGRYARARQADNALMGVALDAIYRIYTDERDVVRRGRRALLGLAQRLGPVKQQLISRALLG